MCECLTQNSLSYTANMKRRIDSKVSQTAQMTCLSRAVSFYEETAFYKSGDNFAPMLIPALIDFLIKKPIFRKFYQRHAPPGIYEYVIARTKYIDDVFDNFAGQIEQVLIFGAGFDTRSIRFRNKLQHAALFELDMPIIQNAKVKRFSEKKIILPANLKFISIDFDNEQLSQKLENYGFQKNKKSLFILEGLTMYLYPESIDSTFSLIESISGENSVIVFDHIYKSVLRQENLFYGEVEAFQSVVRAGERWNFGIEKGKINEFLNKYNLTMVDEADAIKLEERYFRDEEGNKVAKINGTHCLVIAKKT